MQRVVERDDELIGVRPRLGDLCARLLDKLDRIGDVFDPQSAAD